ncbi:atp synthase subunit mitochondrial [Neofusicoccum parvum]|uniref:Atp synthase subunit mitochondrial n=1 Tax=Neofusicoccum parvum TaxID=310453 RepID=A0ACB5S395_9PEZI|nr:atp synthase subunit mitochondrial [Neofusicoccum parvum]GME57323.1 atp synthase subunit mitochondrial [Neofusicoccum parvum]
MAEQITHDVVNEAQSMGGPSPIDVNATTTSDSSAGAAPDTNSANQDQPATSSTTATNHSALPLKTTPPPDSSDAAKASLAVDGSQKQPASDATPEVPKEPTVNGNAASLPPLDDPAGLQSAADTSGGSDTDTSRAGKDGTRSTVKKPTSFKSVSVTKNFLAKTAVSAPVKVGDKGPDPNMVWNKNRPTPPPPVKQFTDEELKQQFGIHMATRLQADEDTKESKWADIDEDEDENWAPETVEWMDGTKSTVKPAEPSPPPEEPPKPETQFYGT